MIHWALGLFLAAQASSEAPDGSGGGPQASALALSTGNAGRCHVRGTVAQNATVVLRWTMVDVDDQNFELVIERDGVELTTLPCTSDEYTHTITGQVEEGPANRVFVSWDYSVKVRRLSDSSIVSSVSATWQKNYGTCEPVT